MSVRAVGSATWSSPPVVTSNQPGFQTISTTTHQTVPVCGKCNQIIEGKFVTVGNQNFHPGCFCCAQCHTAIGEAPYRHGKTGEALCRNCSAVVCNKCGLEIEGTAVQADGQSFHPHCFSCDVCHNVLTDQRYHRSERDGYLRRMCDRCVCTKHQATVTSVGGPVGQAVQSCGCALVPVQASPPGTPQPITTTTTTETWETTTTLPAVDYQGCGYGSHPGYGAYPTSFAGPSAASYGSPPGPGSFYAAGPTVTHQVCYDGPPRTGYGAPQVYSGPGSYGQIRTAPRAGSYTHVQYQSTSGPEYTFTLPNPGGKQGQSVYGQWH